MLLQLAFVLAFGAVFSSVTPHSPDVEDSKLKKREVGAHDFASNHHDAAMLEESLSGDKSMGLQPRTKRFVTSWTPKLSKWADTVGESEDKVTVVCTGNSTDIQWMNPKNKEIKSKSLFNDRVYVDKPKAGNFLSTLQIKKVELSNAGSYSCINKVGASKSNPAVFRLTVLPKPKAKLKPDEDKVKLVEGNNYNVTCSGNWNNVTWQNSNGVAAFTYAYGTSPIYAFPGPATNSSTLTFKNVTTAHSGTYYCVVNIHGKEKKEKLKLTVDRIKLEFEFKGYPIASTSSDNNNNLWLDENKITEISCHGAVSLASINWKLNGVAIPTYLNNRGYVSKTEMKGREAWSTLKVEYPAKSIEGGQYLCSGLSLFDNSKIEKYFYLRIKEDPNVPVPSLVFDSHPFKETDSETLKVNQSLTIECAGSLERYSWFGPTNKSVTMDISGYSTDRVYATEERAAHPRLHFNKIAIADEGEYSCVGYKGSKSQRKVVTIKVFEPAYFNGTQASPVIVNTTANVTLQCSVGGHPMPTVQWKFQDAVIHDDPRRVYNGTSLTILNASSTDTGKYACIATQPNIGGTTIEKTIELGVLHKPWFPEQKETVVRLLKTTATLLCHCSAYPPANYTWYKNGAILITARGLLAANRTKETVEIPFSRPEDLGLYQCRAENQMGFSVKNITVVAMQLPLTPKITPTDATTSTILVRIEMPGNETIVKYQINFTDTNWTNWKTYNFSADSTTKTAVYKVDDLKKKTEYTLKARALNALGFGNFSGEVKYKTSFSVRLSVSITPWISVAVIFFSLSSNRLNT